MILSFREKSEQYSHVVGDALVSYPDVNEKLMIPVLILDSKTCVDLDLIIGANKEYSGGDVVCIWGVGLFDKNSAALRIEFKSPVRSYINIFLT